MSERALGAQIAVAGVGANHVPRRIADHGVETGARQARRRRDRRTPPGTRAPSERDDGGWPASSAASRYRLAVFGGSALRPVRIASDKRAERGRRRRIVAWRKPRRAPESAIRFHRDERRRSRPVSAANARSFARTCSSVSFGIASSEKRTGSACAQRRVDRARRRRAAARFAAAARRPGVRRPAEIGEPRAEQAVADLQAMIEKAERPIGGQRRQPERQPRELHGHRVQIDAVQAALGDRAPNGGPLCVADVARVAGAGADQRRLVRARQIAAGGHQKRAAAHRRIDDPELQDVVRCRRRARAGRACGGRRSRRSAAACRTSRSPCGGPTPAASETLPSIDPRLRSRAASRRPRRAARRRGRDRRCARGPPRSGAGRVDSATTARLAASSSRSRRSASGVRAGANRRPLNGVTRRSPARQPAVRQARDRAQRIPEARGRAVPLRDVAQRFEAVALAVDRMPQRHQRARFGEQQEQDAIDDRERLLEGDVEIDAPAGTYPRGGRLRARRGSAKNQRLQHFARRGEHAVAQRPADAGGMAIGGGDQGVQRSLVARTRPRARLRRRSPRARRGCPDDRARDRDRIRRCRRA